PRESDLAERRDVELGVDRRGVERAVSQEVCDLLEARPSADHTARHGVPEDVGTLERRRDFGASQRPNHSGGDDGTRDGVAAVTPEVLHEHAALAGPRALAAQVVDDRAARVARKREDRSAARLARPEVEGAGTPVDVV